MKQHIDKITDQVFQGIQEWRDGKGTKTTEQASELSKLSDKELKEGYKAMLRDCLKLV
jgi:hypothetical protein